MSVMSMSGKKMTMGKGAMIISSTVLKKFAKPGKKIKLAKMLKIKMPMMK